MKENKNIVNNNTINEENLNKKSSYLSENLNLKTSENQININSNKNKEEVVYSEYITTMKSDSISPFCLCPKSRIYLKSNGCCIAILALSLIIITNIFQNIFAHPKLTPKTLKIIMIILHNLDTLITLYFFFDISTTSPGYQEIKDIINFEEFQKIKPFIKINNETIYLKFCQTCKIIRKPRTFHCKYCNKCVLRQDHHCDFVNNCIGRNNYIKFIIFLINVFIYCLLTLIINILFFCSIDFKFSEFILYCCFNFINLFLGIFFGAQMLIFLISHFKYMCNNITTRESIKKNINKETLNKGCKNNCNISCNKDYVEDFDKKYDEVINSINNKYNNNNNNDNTIN